MSTEDAPTNTTNGAPTVAALSIEQIRAQVREEIRNTMIAQNADLIETTNRNTIRLLEDDRRRAAPHLLETISNELKEARKKETRSWKQEINRSNFDALKDAEMIYNRAQRLVEASEVREDAIMLKEGAIDLMNQGKKILNERLKLIRFADKEGWAAALNFEGDDIAENEAEAKKMRKSKKDTEAEKEKEKEKRSSARCKDRSRNGGYGQGSSNYRRNDSQGYRDRSSLDSRMCYKCRERGHIAANCPY